MTTQTSSRRPTLVRPVDRKPFWDIEPPLNEAAYLATALAMAIEGLGKIDVDAECERTALGWLANEVQLAAHKAREACEQALEASGSDAAQEA
jgi:hypothetical protein